MAYKPKIRKRARYQFYGGGTVLFQSSPPPPQITVQDIDGIPTFNNITTLQFDQGDGFTISEPIAGTARIDFAGGGGGGGLGDPGGNGIVVRTALDTTINRSIVASGAGISITNGDGVAANPSVGLANDAAALEALAGTGFAVRTGADAWAQRSLVQPAAGLTISNGDGVAGNPTFALANDLAAIEGLVGTGIAARTAANTWATRTLTGTANRVVVTNGDGALGDPTFDIGTDVVTLTGSQVLTNKTLTSPTIGDFSNAGHNHQNAAGGGALDVAAITSGVFAKARQHANTVYSDQANTWSTGAQDMGSASSFKVPTSGGAAPTAAGLLAYDSTSHILKAGINGATVELTSFPIASYVISKPGVSQIVMRFVADRAFNIPSQTNGTNANVKAGTAANAQADFTLHKNGGAAFATLRFAAAGTQATWQTVTSTDFAAGDVLTIQAPSSQDSALADIGFTITAKLK